jgi:hypothetical protein
MHEKFPHFRSMGLVGRGTEIELHRADDSPRGAGDENAAASGPNRGQNFVIPKCVRVVV